MKSYAVTGRVSAFAGLEDEGYSIIEGTSTDVIAGMRLSSVGDMVLLRLAVLVVVEVERN